MLELDGLAAADEISAVAPATGVVMLTTFGEDEYIAHALGGGAAGFLLKASDPRELITAVRAVADGAAFLSPAVARRVIRAYPGRSNAEIARSLYVVEGTVKAHVSSILVKLDARNRVEAAILAYDAGLIGRP